ncbi:MAG: PDC sensor domain-containing protein [Gammaproteobacteria bacterium]|nr:PDC sensor domain-containing protein [Gammaproteobacteria bacterium]MBU1724146.1 PDC sensor domain-containing protein [Gammaproteobacteria bacterium]MBU2006450.1 PDC sensor domain-containing protein [Gammaproteobacteria bacterium]
MSQSIQHSINNQRALLTELIGTALSDYAGRILPQMDEAEKLDECLRKAFNALDHCKYVYVLDANGVQLSSTINRYGADAEARGRDRSERPYMLPNMQDASLDFNLSEAYISRNKKRPSVTAIQTIRDASGQRVGFLGVDYDLRELPHSNVMYEEPSQWRQIKGDPAIRQGVFFQQRVESVMDRHIDNVLSVHEALMLDHGVHHVQIHFSSSRSTIWHVDDPYVYRILTMDELSDPGICMAYPRRPYFERAIVLPQEIGQILKLFKTLRFTDETIYLRYGSLNIVNGKVGLNFSCDGTHYLNHDEFLAKGMDFWFGGENFPQAIVPAVPVDEERLDEVVEEIASTGCIQVNKLLYALEKDEVPEVLAGFNHDERDYIYRELKSVMDVYEGGVCGL